MIETQASKNRLAAPLSQRHCLRSRDDSIAKQRSFIFSYFNYRLLMIIVYTACMLDYAHKIAVFNFFSINSTVS